MPVPALRHQNRRLEQWFYRAPNESVSLIPNGAGLCFPCGTRPSKAFSSSIDTGSVPTLAAANIVARSPIRPTRKSISWAPTVIYATINEALQQWATDKKLRFLPPDPSPAEGAARDTVSAVIEITDSAAYTEKLALKLAPYESLQIRAAQGRRPDASAAGLYDGPGGPLSVSGGKSSRFTLDGLL